MKHLLVLPLMVLAFKHNQQSSVRLPIWALIEVIGSAAGDAPFLVICTDEGQFHIFGLDKAGWCSRDGSELTKRESSNRAKAPKGSAQKPSRCVA